MTYNYQKEPVTLHYEPWWVVNDPWTAQDIGWFRSLEAAELFAETWMGREQ
jgi:hypothetical protein